MVEELTEDEVRAQLETNLFGALWVTQAALPIMRAQGSGTSPGVEHRRHQCLPDGRRLPRVEVGARGHLAVARAGGRRLRHLRHPGRAGRFSTDWSGPSSKHSTEDPAYAEVREAASKRPSAADPGKPEATRSAILKVVDAEQPPLRVFFGKAPLGIAERDYESRLATWREWQPVAEEAHGA